MTAVVPRRAWVEQIMGLPISIHVRGGDPSDAHVEHIVARVFADLCHADAVLSPYRADSDLSRWERGEVALADAALHPLGSAHREQRHMTHRPAGLTGQREVVRWAADSARTASGRTRPPIR